MATTSAHGLADGYGLGQMLLTHMVMDIPLLSGMLTRGQGDLVVGVAVIAGRVVDQAVDQVLEVLILVLPDHKRCFALRNTKQLIPEYLVYSLVCGGGAIFAGRSVTTGKRLWLVSWLLLELLFDV